MKNRNSLTRRELLKNSTIIGTGATLAPFHLPKLQDRFSNQRVIQENAKEGTLEWQLQYTGFDAPLTMASYPLNRYLRSIAIEGFVSKTSLYPGQSLDFMVSTSENCNFHIDIYRMGYYGGKGGRHMMRLGSFQGKPQEVPMMKMERLRECQWEKSTSLTIPQDWPSGVYLGKLSRDEKYGKQSYVIFVVKSRESSDILCQVSDLTWQAYNKWPGNNSLYDNGTPQVWYTGRNVRVSFDRPYAKYPQILDSVLSTGSGEYLLWEHPMTYWLEKEGYDVNYCSNLDLHFDAKILDRSKVFLSIGHDEYWTREMFNNAIKARDNGLSLAFFSGNSVAGEIQFHDSQSGVPGRSYSKTENIRFDDENKLMGVSSYGVGYGDWKVKNKDHWIYEGTNMQNDDIIPGIIGWEYHGAPFGDHEGLEVVAENLLSPASPNAKSGKHSGIIYPVEKGNWVFNAGTIWWSEGLAQPPGHVPAGSGGMEEFLRPGEYPAGHDPGGRTFGVDPRVQRITANILNRMIKDSPK